MYRDMTSIKSNPIVPRSFSIIQKLRTDTALGMVPFQKCCFTTLPQHQMSGSLDRAEFVEYQYKVVMRTYELHVVIFS